MRTSPEFLFGSVCKERALTRAQFDALSDEEQIDMVAHYLAEQQLAKWQNYRDVMSIRNQQSR